ASVVTVASFVQLVPERYSIVACVAAAAGRTRPQSDTLEPLRNAASGRRKLVSTGLALPAFVRRPDSKPEYLSIGDVAFGFGASSRRRYCEKATIRGF